MKKLFLLLFTIILYGTQAQVKFYARVSNNQITTDDRVRISFIAQGTSNDIDDGRITPPSFEGFRAMGPFVSQEFSYINGRSSYKKSYTYTLQPEKTGKFVIKPAKFSVGDKVYQTQPITIDVTKGVIKPNPRPQVSNGTLPSTGTTQSINTKDILLVAQLTKNNPYINEAVGLTYRLYIPKKYGVQNYQELSQPQFNGFWAQDVDRNISGPYEGTFNGKDYVYYILKKKLLFPQQTGKLKIKPLTLSIDIEKPVIRQMGFFQIRDFELERIKLSSGSKTIQVKDLPEKDKPLDFTGAVGQFDFSVKVDNNEVKTGDPVNISLQVSGTGNLKLFDLPKLKTPEDLEVYDPKHTENVRTTFAGNKGSVKDEYVVIPNKPGKFIIPGISFSYFDPAQGKYITKTTDDIVIIAKGKGNYTENSVVSNQDFQANDFRFIKENADFVPKKHTTFYKTKTFYGLLLTAVLLALILFGYKKYSDNRVIDETTVRSKKQSLLAKKYLKEAKAHLNDKDKFYTSLERAVYNFLKAKLRMDTSALSKENIKKLLSDKNIDNSTIDELMQVLNRCEMARYTPANFGTLEKDLKITENLMNIIDKKI